jgi:protein-S-isoprenylcysteine O-methyltransferase Ste14
MGDAGPGVRVPPPVLVAAALLTAALLRTVAPLPVGPPAPALGYAVVVLGIALIGWSLATMLRAGTDPRPDRPDAKLLQSGPFRFGRNPVYLGFLLIAAGVALRFGDLWLWLAVLASFALLRWMVIAREEAYLAARFNADYAAYRARVRRWL